MRTENKVEKSDVYSQLNMIFWCYEIKWKLPIVKDCEIIMLRYDNSGIHDTLIFWNLMKYDKQDQQGKAVFNERSPQATQ
jgi:hypothetical protein